MNRIFSLAKILCLSLLFSCTEVQRDNPYDEKGINYKGGNNITYYRTVTIGTQVWMAENLNYNASGSKCYDNKPENCVVYGRLYSWATAMNLPASCNSGSCLSQISVKHRGICPEGWHIPSVEDWNVLRGYVDSEKSGIYLKATSGWLNDDDDEYNDKDEYGFSALPGGSGSSRDGSFYGVGENGYWWTSSQTYNNVSAYYLGMWSGTEYTMYLGDAVDNKFHYINSKGNLHSVRCLQDTPSDVDPRVCVVEEYCRNCSPSLFTTCYMNMSSDECEELNDSFDYDEDDYYQKLAVFKDCPPGSSRDNR